MVFETYNVEKHTKPEHGASRVNPRRTLPKNLTTTNQRGRKTKDFHFVQK